MTWKSGRSLKEVTGKPVRMRVALQDAEFFFFRFRDSANLETPVSDDAAKIDRIVVTSILKEFPQLRWIGPDSEFLLTRGRQFRDRDRVPSSQMRVYPSDLNQQRITDTFRP